MLRPGRDDGRRPVLQLALLSVENGLPHAILNPDELVAASMSFEADVLARLQRHHHQLAERTGERAYVNFSSLFCIRSRNGLVPYTVTLGVQLLLLFKREFNGLGFDVNIPGSLDISKPLKKYIPPL